MNENEIVMYFHCKQCLESLPAGVSPKDHARIQAGWTNKGIQVWCSRHDIGIVHLDFKGQKVAYA